jgi:hypothetical protein
MRYVSQDNYVLEDSVNGAVHSTCHGPDRIADAALIARLLNEHEAAKPVDANEEDPFLPPVYETEP